MMKNLEKIDIHTHFVGYWDDPNNKRLDEKMVEQYLEFNIKKACVSILGTNGKTSDIYLPTPEDILKGNDEMVKTMKIWPDFVIGFLYINPVHERQWPGMLKEYYEKYGIKGIKLGAALKCTDKRMNKLMEASIEYNLPVFQHLGHNLTVDSYPNIVSDSTELAELAKRYPEAKIIMAHIGGGGDWRWGIRAIKHLPNIMVDISGSCFDIGLIDFACKEIGAERVAFGTDISLFSSIAKIENAHLSPEDERKICWTNAAKILNI
jgi:uncharacterized protein